MAAKEKMEEAVLGRRRLLGCLRERHPNGVQRSAAFSSVCKLLKMERETGFEPATSSLGI